MAVLMSAMPFAQADGDNVDARIMEILMSGSAEKDTTATESISVEERKAPEEPTSDACPKEGVVSMTETGDLPETAQTGEVKPEPDGGATAGGDAKSDAASVADATGSGSLSETGEVQQPTHAAAELRAPERLLSRPGAILYQEPDEKGTRSNDYLPNYSILTVLEEKDDWFRVAAKTGGEAKGWLKRADIIPWKHQLVVQFAPPAGRQRTLFFGSRDDAAGIAAMGAEARKERLQPVYDAIGKKTDLEDDAVLACEPDGWAEMKNNFYLMPIVEFDRQPVDMGDEQAQLIRVAAATENRDNSSETDNTAGMTMDMVFVMDLSRSMGPIKDQALDAVRKIARAVEANPELKPDTVRFGFWGYRDDTDVCKGIEYVTKNYTPEELLRAGDFVKILEQAQATKTDSVDYAEDVLAGVHDAVLQTKWREGAARVLMLIGDAPGREPGQTDPFSARRDKPVGTAADMGIEQIAALAHDKQVEVGTIYLNVERYKEHLPLARVQFEGLASKTVEKAAKVITVSEPGEFDRFSQDAITTIVAQVKQAAVQKAEIKPETEGQAFATSLFRNAKVRWLSQKHRVGVTPEMNGWLVDRDLADPLMPAVTPCVLLNREQLDALKLLLRDVIDAGENAKGTSTDFMKALKTVVIAGSKDPEMLKDVRTLADSRFIPSFLKELPYQSKIMQLGDEEWRAMQSDAQDKMILTAKNKLKYYEDLYKDNDIWMPLDENESESLRVTPVPLDQLP